MKRFWDYWKENYEIAKAGKEFTAVAILILIYIVLGLCRWYGLQNAFVKEWDKYFGYVEMGLAIFFTAYALIWLPVKRHELERGKTEQEKASRKSLEIEGVPFKLATHTRYICTVRVHNRSQEITANNVSVELLEMEASTSKEESILHPDLPFVLSPLNRGQTPSINPGGKMDFVLFDVTKSEHWQAATPDVHQWLMFLKFNQEGKHALAINNIKYRYKIRATAQDFPAQTTDFYLGFAGVGNDITFIMAKT